MILKGHGFYCFVLGPSPVISRIPLLILPDIIKCTNLIFSRILFDNIVGRDPHRTHFFRGTINSELEFLHKTCLSLLRSFVPQYPDYIDLIYDLSDYILNIVNVVTDAIKLML